MIYAQMIRKVQAKLRRRSPYRFDDSLVHATLKAIADSIPYPERHGKRREIVARAVAQLTRAAA